LKSKVRHFYDLNFLSISDTCGEYLHTKDFHDLFNQMFEEDKTKFEDPDIWLKSPYTDSPILTSFDEIWDELKDIYNTDFRLLVHGGFPEDELVADQF